MPSSSQPRKNYISNNNLSVQFAADTAGSQRDLNTSQQGKDSKKESGRSQEAIQSGAWRMRENIEMERSINRKLIRQNDLNVRVGSLVQDSNQTMNIHKKFKQFVGYRDGSVNRHKS